MKAELDQLLGAALYRGFITGFRCHRNEDRPDVLAFVVSHSHEGTVYARIRVMDFGFARMPVFPFVFQRVEVIKATHDGGIA